jgi:hypothetical protein
MYSLSVLFFFIIYIHFVNNTAFLYFSLDIFNNLVYSAKHDCDGTYQQIFVIQIVNGCHP